MPKLHDNRFGVRLVCDACHGTGKSDAIHPAYLLPRDCPTCGGFGFIERRLRLDELLELLEACELPAEQVIERRTRYEQGMLW